MNVTALFALLVSIAGFCYTVWRDRAMAARMKRVEAEQQKQQAEVALRHSKASAPYFSPSKAPIGQVYDIGEKGQPVFWAGINQNILSTQHREIKQDIPEGTPVIVVLDNHGKVARRITLSGEIPDAHLRQEPPVSGAHGLIFLKYPYSPSQHGEIQRISISFESEDGYDLTHVYETRHGFFEFHRVEPK